MSRVISKAGEISTNNNGSKMVIETYINNRNVLVRFIDNGYTVHTDYQTFRKGGISNPLDRTLSRVGYIGIGDYKTGTNGKFTKQYVSWSSMINRCYNEKMQEKYPSYKDCIVAGQWHNYQVFAKWFDENYYEIEGETMCLDKDILYKGNKVYSPTTCIFVPQTINALFIKRDNKRGKYPIGVTWSNSNKKYMATCSNKGERINLGSYDTPDQAFLVYKIYKENLIKQIANEYKGKIPEALYNVMIKYKVDIND